MQAIDTFKFSIMMHFDIATNLFFLLAWCIIRWCIIRRLNFLHIQISLLGKIKVHHKGGASSIPEKRVLMDVLKRFLFLLK